MKSYTDLEIYEKFIEWLGKTWWGLPESDQLMPIIKARYTVEEAEFLTGMPFSGSTLEELAEAKKRDPKELVPCLDDLARKGIIFRRQSGDSTRYSLNDSYFVFLRSSFWPGKDDDEASRKMAPHVNKYFFDGFYDQYVTVHAKGLRALPIQQTIEDTRQILPYEDVVQVLDNFEYFTVSTCPCRQRKKLDDESHTCRKPMGNCLHFDILGRYCVENGMGREITREEAEQILKESADAGLVHGVSNWREKPDTICNCCSCCCLWMEAYHKLDHHKSLDASNYRVEIKPETCKACGLCVKRCPMDAIQLKFSSKATNKFSKAPVLDPDLCLGCGVCVHKCPTDSLTLKSKEEIVDPPTDIREYSMRFMADRKTGVPLRRK
ncbi:MAG: 4Fe-4S binding protein [Desulfobacterales bacterium]|nr:MAG: 4Fe-4S binding protein [Desulfobacterales bacterium]